MPVYRYHTHRIIEVIAENDAHAEQLVEAELHDDESVLSVEVISDDD